MQGLPLYIHVLRKRSGVLRQQRMAALRSLQGRKKQPVRSRGKDVSFDVQCLLVGKAKTRPAVIKPKEHMFLRA